MEAIKVPTLILSGEFDRVVPPGNANLMAEKIADSRVEIISHTGHMFPIEDPPAAANVIRSFLSEA
jgi:pimeloyl-ACP methyl ester carboxylesterase